MEIRFRGLYEEGKDDKKHRFRPDIIERYRRRIKLLMLAERIEDLFVYPGLNYKVLTGDKAGRSAIRVNDQYRIEFDVEKGVVTICNILELSNHYK